MLSSEEIEVRYGAGRKRDRSLPSKAPVHRDLREIVKTFAEELDAWLPDGRYKDLALTDLESASSWAHKAIQNDL